MWLSIAGTGMKLEGQTWVNFRARTQRMEAFVLETRWATEVVQKIWKNRREK